MEKTDIRDPSSGPFFRTLWLTLIFLTELSYRRAHALCLSACSAHVVLLLCYEIMVLFSNTESHNIIIYQKKNGSIKILFTKSF